MYNKVKSKKEKIIILCKRIIQIPNVCDITPTLLFFYSLQKILVCMLQQKKKEKKFNMNIVKRFLTIKEKYILSHLSSQKDFNQCALRNAILHLIFLNFFYNSKDDN